MVILSKYTPLVMVRGGESGDTLYRSGKAHQAVVDASATVAGQESAKVRGSLQCSLRGLPSCLEGKCRRLPGPGLSSASVPETCRLGEHCG